MTRGFATSVDEARRVVTTEEGEELPFDVLLVAAGATASEAVPGGLTFRGTEPGTAASAVSTEMLWWPPAKVVGRHLAPFLAEIGLDCSSPPPVAMERRSCRGRARSA